MKKITFSITFYLFIIIPSFLFSQELPIKPGKISEEELTMEYCPIDSNARAMIICDYGKSYFIFSDDDGFRLHFDRILRIKIFNKEGYDWADHSISLYKNGVDREKITKLKASTYNLENGKIIKEKLKNSDVYSEEQSKHYDLEKFSMPQVREGSVIEIEYSISSDFFFNLKSWYFQHDIPTLWSEYSINIPEYFQYKKTQKGYLFATENESNIKRKSISTTTKERGGSKYVQKTSYDTQTVYYDELQERWILKDVPAFIKEEPLTSSENYISKMEFELSSIQPPYGRITYYTKTWEDINELLLDDVDFGGQLNGGGYLKDIVEEINSAGTDDISKIVLAYQYIQDHMKWDGYNSVSVNDNLRSVYNEQSGNCAEINLMLVVLLKKLGVESYPVIISTRSNGIIHPSQPTISSFNYVLAYAEVNDNYYLMDATDPKIPFGTLPKRTLNGKGRLVSKDKTDWVNLDTDKPYKEFWMYNLSLNDEMEFTGNIQAAFNDYAAYNQRKKVDSYGDEGDYIKNIEDNNPGLLINNFELINAENYNEALKEKFEISITDKTQGSDEIIYFNPMFYEAIEENPFKLVERKYPVEFAYPTENSCMFIFTVPEGYKVDEMPQSTAVDLPDKGGSFRFTSSLMGNTLQIISKVQITRKIFLPGEYDYLKEFYNHIINKHAELVVLSKQ